MMDGKESLAELRLLITLSIEGTATPEQMARLNAILAGSEEARRYYFEFVDIQVLTEHLCSEKMFFDETGKGVQDEIKKQDMLLKSLALDEMRADTVEVKKTEVVPEHEIVRPIQAVRVERKIRKSTILSFAISAAAILFLILFVWYAPTKLGYEVATLTDSISAEWTSDKPIQSGLRLATSYTPVLLKEGLIQLLFDNGTEVVIEAPAEFHLVADDQIKLSYGRVYSRVPKQAIGFTVSCRDTKVIDLGTEFGVYSELNGGIELHVLEGKTLLFAEDKSGVKSLEVHAGTAKKVSPWQTIVDIPCNKRAFARSINSQENRVWRGQKPLDLTDMVTGGDGSNTNRGLGKIDVLTGERTGLLYVSEMSSNPGFQASPQNPFVDGVFVPDRGGSEVVSSTGLRFEDCPDTTGTAFYHISTIRDIPAIGSSETYFLALSEKSGRYPSTLLLHSNAGITYDLSAIRAHYTNWQVTSFATSYGFPASLYEKMAKASGDDLVRSSGAGTVNFYILIDGRIRRKIPFVMGMPPNNVQIPISDQDRFLSLVCTDSDGNNSYDWLVLENPKLYLEE